CMTRDCVDIASSIARSLDESVDPCQDFYEFACGGWESRNLLPSGESRWSGFNALQQSNQAIIKIMLEKNISSSHSEAEKKAKLFYESCINLDAINKQGAEPLLQMINNVSRWVKSYKELIVIHSYISHIGIISVGGWPVLGNWNVSEFNFNETIRRFFPYSIYPFLSIGVETDSKHSNSNVVIVGESGLSLGTRNWYVNKTIVEDKILSTYLEYMTQVATLLGAEDRNVTRDVLELEKQMAIISLPVEQMRNQEKNYHPDGAERFAENDITPAIDWLNLVPELFSKLANESVGMDEPVITFSIEYMKKISAIIHNTPKRILGNYFGWRFVRAFVGAMGQPFLDAENVFHKVQYGSNMVSAHTTEQYSSLISTHLVNQNVFHQECLERWRSCLGTVDSILGLAVGRLFVQKKFAKTSKSSVKFYHKDCLVIITAHDKSQFDAVWQAEEMVREIKASFQANLPKIPWMDPVTRKKASEKCSAVEDLIGFDDKMLNTTDVDDKYSEVAHTGYFEHHVSALKYLTERGYKLLRKPVKRKEWTVTPPTVNAYYSPTKNIIVFPAGILQPPFYSSGYPKSINYGGIGIVVGHELTHGFDDQGRQYDLHGNLKKWWKKETLAKFKEKADCMAKQYSRFDFDGAQVNGNLTLGENIADNGGVRLAYNAYQVWKQTNGSSEMLLPSLNYTHNQLFFISFAQLWCSLTTPQALKHQVKVDVHSPPKPRVIGSLSNFAEFSKAFNCPSGSPMNPVEKCKVW
uniref:Endothelin-converting enzyme 1 n=1 Tax=Ciona savignyi TaxID=51511 RepID=H2ZFD6_CIOSA